MELELDKSRQEREIRDLKEEIKGNEEDIKRERTTISSLKVTYIFPAALMTDVILPTLEHPGPARDREHRTFCSNKCT